MQIIDDQNVIDIISSKKFSEITFMSDEKARKKVYRIQTPPDMALKIAEKIRAKYGCGRENMDIFEYKFQENKFRPENLPALKELGSICEIRLEAEPESGMKLV